MLIMGDTIIDETWYVDARKLSPEAPIPVGYLTSSVPHRSPGGASLAASYALKQGYPFTFLTATSNNNTRWLAAKGMDVHSLQSVDNVTKTRYIDVNSNYHLLRIDNDEVVTFPSVTSDKLSPVLEELLDKATCLIMLDYRKGIFSNLEAVKKMIAEAVRRNLPVYVDTRCSPSKFRMSTYLKLNEKEYVAACAALGFNNYQDLCSNLNIPNVIVTEGKRGATLHSVTNETFHSTPSKDRYKGIPDVTGCGDVFDVNFCYYCFQEGLPPTEALKLSVERASEYAHTTIGDRLC